MSLKLRFAGALNRSFFFRAFLLLVLLPGGWSFAQVTVPDTAFGMKSLGYEDIIAALPEDSRQIFGANRLAESVDELPLRAYIVSREEIMRNGYVTLVDVLKNIPGFRTSQPGEALLGETFLMRGLVGNLYTKILINGISLDPSAAKGMPLAAFLPIRQAQRIEIILGPASSLYGPDALAGVINIVLPTIERPVEAMGSVALGNRGAIEMHLALGGKIGRGKNVLNYMIYGSSRDMNDIGLALPDELIRLDSASPAIRSPEYRFEDQDSFLPQVDEFPHESRLIGVSLSYRGLSFNSNTLFRSDNVALGSHPEDISYDFPHGKIIDRIYANRLRYETTVGRLSLRTNLSSVIYEIDNQSEYRGIAHPISVGTNHIYASSHDILGEQLAFFQVNKKLLLMGGVSYEGNFGDAFQGYLARPFGDASVQYDSLQDAMTVQNSSDDFSAIAPRSIFNEYELHQIGAFAQVNYQTKRFRVTTGGRVDRANDGDLRLSPKLGATVKLTEKIRMRGFFGQAYRSPSTYNRYNNYEERLVPPPPPMPMQPPGDSTISLVRVKVDSLDEESLTSIEGGVVFDIGHGWRAEVHFFRHVLENSIFPSKQFSTQLGQDLDDGPPDPTNPDGDNNLFGFFNANSRSTLNAFQGFLSYESRIFRMDLYGQWNIGQEAIVGLDTVNSYRSLPEFMGQANFHFNFPKIIRVSIYSQFFSEFTWGIVKVNDDILVKESDGFYNVDLVIGKDFTSRFLGYFRMTNVLNSTSRGIFTTDVSGYQFDYMPQQQRLFTIGLTYHL